MCFFTIIITRGAKKESLCTYLVAHRVEGNDLRGWVTTRPWRGLATTDAAAVANQRDAALKRLGAAEYHPLEQPADEVYNC